MRTTTPDGLTAGRAPRQTAGPLQMRKPATLVQETPPVSTASGLCYTRRKSPERRSASPMTDQLATVTLRCKNCGSSLSVGPTVDQFACAYCGTEQIVTRSGGTVSLAVVAEAVEKLQRGTDKVAAELAIRRLEAELATLVSQRNAMMAAPRSEAELQALGCGGLILIISVGLLLALVEEYRSGRWDSQSETFSAIVVVGLIIGIAIVVSLLRGNRASTDVIDRQIQEVTTKLDENRALVE